MYAIRSYYGLAALIFNGLAVVLSVIVVLGIVLAPVYVPFIVITSYSIHYTKLYDLQTVLELQAIQVL